MTDQSRGNKAVKTVILLERSQDVSGALSGSNIVTSEVRYIALRPEVSLALDLAGIEHGVPADYTDGDRIYQDGLSSFKEIHELCTQLDKRLAAIHGLPQLRPAAYAFYHLKILWDVFFTTISVIDGIFRREAPERILIYAPEGSTSSPYAFSNDESVYAAVLRLDGWPADVETVETTWNGGTHTPVSTNVGSLRSKLKHRSSLFNFSFIARKRGIRGLLPAILRSAIGLSDTPLILYESGYNWDDALPELYRSGFSRIIRIWDSSLEPQNSNMEQYREAILDTCYNTPACRDLGKRGLVDASPILFEKLAWIVSRATAEALATYPEMVRAIRDRHVGAVLLSVRESAIGHALVQAAHDCDIPVISWQHGGAGYCYHPLMPFIESIGSNIHLTFGDSVAASYLETYSRMNFPRVPQIVAVGSSSLDQLRYVKSHHLPKQSERKTILYVTTSYLHNQYTISSVHDPTAYDEKLWSVQKTVLNLARAHPEHNFIVKLHPSHASQEPLKRYIEYHRISNVHFVVQTPSLPDLLQEADVLLFDLISTGILQALQTDLPIFLYTGLSAVDTDTLCLLQRRVSTSDNVEEYASTLGGYLSGDINGSTANIHDAAFITEFGTLRGDGLSAERAAEAIRKAIHAKSRR